MRTILTLYLLCVAPIAWAASPEEAYLAARDRAIAVLKKAGSGGAGDALVAEEKRLRSALEAPLRRLIGPLTLDGFPGPATMSPDTLLSDDIGFGALDGIRLGAQDQSGSVLVTTDGLLRRWLSAHKDWWKDQPNAPTDPDGAFRSEAFYTQAVSADAAVSIFAPLPILKPAAAATTVALLVEESQDLAIEPPGEIAVAVAKGGRIFVAIVNSKTKLAPIPACDAVWKGSKAKSEAALAAYNASGLKDQKSFNASTRFESEGAAAFRKCWSERAGGERAFPALVRQAQALADRFAAR